MRAETITPPSGDVVTRTSKTLRTLEAVNATLADITALIKAAR
jgi:hypothetical protein